ncbi:MAG TPA: hypothetical protein VM686_03515 [Polyangiaceae bacterium]|nr:hypothetical protein [Polyangiaceae bacterium]
MPKDSGNEPFEISERVTLQALTRPYQRDPGAPLTRPLKIFTLDPSISEQRGGTATVPVPYEDVAPGPVGCLFEIDASGAPAPLTAEPLDLDEPRLLLSAGLSPTPANGQFHLQMVYAVCNLTYAAFRRALGREVAWACGDGKQRNGSLKLRVRPFAFEDENAYYDRDEGGLSFGYFRAKRNPAGHTVPNGLVFTSLSHDVVAHEAAHALLDGLRSEFYLPTHPDVLGFHEGFADLVALFQHFSYADVVEQAMRESGGMLAQAGLLSALAQEFGHATSTPRRPSALRSAVDVAGLAPFDSDAFTAPGAAPVVYRPDMEEHDLGSVLVSAVFEAFTTVFQRKSARYFRLAGVGPGEVARAGLSLDLVQLLAQEASVLAGQFLNICIRAIDYCPPVDLELGEYLRAIITADADVVQDDKWGYRSALMRSFRRRKLFPQGVDFMSADAVRWQPPEGEVRIDALAFSRLNFDGDPGRPASKGELKKQAEALGRFLSEGENAKALHLVAPGAALPKGVEYAAPPRIQSIRCARRVTPDGAIVFDLVAEVTQSATVRDRKELFDFNGGTTLVIDPYGRVRYAIYKDIGSQRRKQRQLQAMRGSLKGYWQKNGKGRYAPAPGVLKRLHSRK